MLTHRKNKKAKNFAEMSRNRSTRPIRGKSPITWRTRLFISTVAIGLLSTSCTTKKPEPYNLLILSVDSLRADRLRLWNTQDGVATPNLEALARRGTTLRNAWSTSPWTAPSMVSVFTGLFPPSHGVIYRDDTTPLGLDTLPGMLEEPPPGAMAEPVAEALPLI